MYVLHLQKQTSTNQFLGLSTRYKVTVKNIKSKKHQLISKNTNSYSVQTHT